METTDTVLNKVQMDDIMDYDVFLSYPHEDYTEVMRICKALRARELTVWMDESDIPDYASITSSIVDGLARSRVLLAYYSRNYSRSRACQWELTAAFLAAQHEGDPRQRVLVINPENEWEHIQPVELKDAEIPDSDDLDRLVSSVKAHVTEIEGTIGEIHALKPPVWYGRRVIGSNRFVGRLPYMWKIHSDLHASDFPIITGAHASAVVQVHGMGGVGKSLLAEEYALRFAAAFPGGVFWLSAFGNDDVKTGITAEEREAERYGQISGIATDLNIYVDGRSPEEIEGALKWKLGAIEKPFLWVVDDLPSGMVVETLERWLAPHPLGKTLITTRSQEYDSVGTPIPLGVLEQVEAYELLTSRRKPEGEEEEDSARRLVEALGYHALAVDVAGAALHMSAGIQSFADFRKELADSSSDDDVLEFAGELTGTLPSRHEASIASTFLHSIERLKPEGQDFLRLASRLAVAPIPASLISSVFCEVDGLDRISGRRRGTLAIHQADELSLAERVEEEGVWLVHTLISRTMRFRDTYPERSEKLQDAAVKVLTTELQGVDDPRTHDTLKLAVTHAKELVSMTEDLQTADLMERVARYDCVRGAYKSAEELCRREWDLRNRILGEEHPSTLTTMSNLAETLHDQGDLAGVRKLHNQVLEMRWEILGEQHPDTLASMNNLAAVFHAQGDIGRARKLQERVLKILCRVLGEEHPHTLTSMNNLAEMFHAQGDIGRARKLQERVLELKRQILGAEHPDTLKTMSNLATTLQDQGDLHGAREIHEQVLEIRRRILEDEHPDTLMSMSNLADTLRAQGDLAGARKLHEQVLEIKRQVFGEEHPSTLISMNNLADTLQAQGDLAGARKLHEQVLEIKRRVLGKGHPSTLTSISNLAATLHVQGDLAGSRELQEEVLEIRWCALGSEHPDTTLSAWNLFSTYTAMGDSVGGRIVLETDLLWLLDRDPASLGADQQKIRERILQLFG